MGAGGMRAIVRAGHRWSRLAAGSVLPSPVPGLAPQHSNGESSDLTFVAGARSCPRNIRTGNLLTPPSDLRCQVLPRNIRTGNLLTPPSEGKTWPHQKPHQEKAPADFSL